MRANDQLLTFLEAQASEPIQTKFSVTFLREIKIIKYGCKNLNSFGYSEWANCGQTVLPTYKAVL